MRSMTSFNTGWSFSQGFSAERAATLAPGAESVTLPHTAVELPFSYFDEAAYWRAFTYSSPTRTAIPPLRPASPASSRPAAIC